MEQQVLALGLQVLPTVVQVPVPGVGWQVPPLQTVEQQSALPEQLVPSDLQAVALQVPPEQLPWQQSRLEVQEAPAFLQKRLSHLLLVQAPEQHCEPVLQVLKAARQVEDGGGWQVPLVQVPEQHCVPLEQVVPSLKQLVGWQVGLVTPLQ